MSNWTFNAAEENGSHNTTLNAGSTQTLAYSANVAAGDLLLLCILGFQTNYAVTDSQGNSWTRITAYVNRGDGYNGSLWFAVALSSAANTVSVKNNSASNETALGLEISSFSPSGGTAALDQSTTATGNSATPEATVSTTTANGLVIGAPVPFGFPTSALAGFTGTTSFGTNKQPMVYAIEASSGSYTPGVNNGSNIWGFIAATFKVNATATTKASVVVIME